MAKERYTPEQIEIINQNVQCIPTRTITSLNGSGFERGAQGVVWRGKMSFLTPRLPRQQVPHFVPVQRVSAFTTNHTHKADFGYIPVFEPDVAGKAARIHDS